MEETSHGEDELDVTSENFSARRALLDEKAPPMLNSEGVVIYDNIAKYVSVTSGKANLKTQSKEIRELEEKNPVQRKPLRDVLTRMKAFEGGPLAVLNTYCERKRRIKVLTRNYNEVRGICTGYLVAFDKHWNLAMIDVDETYLKKKKEKILWIDLPQQFSASLDFGEICEGDRGERESAHGVAPRRQSSTWQEARFRHENPAGKSFSASCSSESAKGNKKKPGEFSTADLWGARIEGSGGLRESRTHELRQRHVNQLFIRGDNVVLVHLVDI